MRRNWTTITVYNPSLRQWWVSVLCSNLPISYSIICALVLGTGQQAIMEVGSLKQNANGARHTNLGLKSFITVTSV